MKTLKYISRALVLMVFMLSAVSAMAISPTEVLNKASQKINAAKSLSVKFTGSTQGTLVVSGNRFYMVTGGFGVWYDGTDMWTYSQRAGETSLTTPTQAELLESNPMAIVRSYSDKFNVEKLAQGNGTYTVRLTAKSKSLNVKSAVLIINTNTWLPAAIDIVFSNDNRMTVNISSITEGSTLPSKDFVYPAVKYPGVEVVDLR